MKSVPAKDDDDNDIAEDVLIDVAYTHDLDDNDEYFEEMYAKGNEVLAQGEKRFEEGKTANAIGDKFSLASLIYTIALFFAGLALVFKTNIRWGFYAAGLIIFLGSVVYMFTLPMA